MRSWPMGEAAALIGSRFIFPAASATPRATATLAEQPTVDATVAPVTAVVAPTAEATTEATTQATPVPTAAATEPPTQEPSPTASPPPTAPPLPVGMVLVLAGTFNMGST